MTELAARAKGGANIKAKRLRLRRKMPPAWVYHVVQRQLCVKREPADIAQALPAKPALPRARQRHREALESNRDRSPAEKRRRGAEHRGGSSSSQQPRPEGVRPVDLTAPGSPILVSPVPNE